MVRLETAGFFLRLEKGGGGCHTAVGERAGVPSGLFLRAEKGGGEARAGGVGQLDVPSEAKESLDDGTEPTQSGGSWGCVVAMLVVAAVGVIIMSIGLSMMGGGSERRSHGAPTPIWVDTMIIAGIALVCIALCIVSTQPLSCYRG